MTPQFAAELLGTLRQKTFKLDELHERARVSGSTWSPDQLELFLLCVDGVERDDAGFYQPGGNSLEDELQAAIIAAVRSFAGKPVPADQVRARLPNHFVTTDEQVFAVAKRTIGLEVFGPKLIRTSK
jgi:hypothetical protein